MHSESNMALWIRVVKYAEHLLKAKEIKRGLIYLRHFLDRIKILGQVGESLQILHPVMAYWCEEMTCVQSLGLRL